MPVCLRRREVTVRLPGSPVLHGTCSSRGERHGVWATWWGRQPGSRYHTMPRVPWWGRDGVGRSTAVALPQPAWNGGSQEGFLEEVATQGSPEGTKEPLHCRGGKGFRWVEQHVRRHQRRRKNERIWGFSAICLEHRLHRSGQRRRGRQGPGHRGPGCFSW